MTDPMVAQERAEADFEGRQFGDSCPFPVDGDSACPMQVGVVVTTHEGKRRPMCELHFASATWMRRGDDGRLEQYQPLVARPGDRGPATVFI